MSNTYSISIDPIDECKVQTAYSDWTGATVNGEAVHNVIHSLLPRSAGVSFVDGVSTDMTLSQIPEELFLELDKRRISYKIL